MGAATITIRDVAARAGVSPMTVSRVINGGVVSAETRRRVEAAIADLAYVPSRLARGLSAQRTGTLALIVPDVANPFFTLIVRGVEGILIAPVNDRSREHLRRLTAFGIPFVLIDRTVPGVDADAVVGDS